MGLIRAGGKSLNALSWLIVATPPAKGCYCIASTVQPREPPAQPEVTGPPIHQNNCDDDQQLDERQRPATATASASKLADSSKDHVGKIPLENVISILGVKEGSAV